MEDTRTGWSSRMKITVSLLLLGLFVYLLFRFSVVLAPLVLAIILAYVLSPVVNALQGRLGLSRTLSTLITYLALLVILAALPMVLIPPLAAQTTGLNLNIQRLITQIENILGHQYIVAGQVIHPDRVFENLVGALQGMLEPVFGQTLNLALDAISSVVWVIFIFVVSVYLVKDGPQLRRWLEQIVPPDYRSDYIRLRDEISLIWSAFFRGQLTLALVVATIFTVIGFVLGLPFALLMGVLAGLLEFLPSIGHGIWLFIASLLALIIGSTWLAIPNLVFMLIIIGLHLAYQQFDLNYLIPRVIGRRVHLHPLVVILGIVSGAVIAGVLGILLAAPTIASARVLGRYVYANLFDLDPFPESEAQNLPAPNPRWWRKMWPFKSSRTNR
jgi:predicted PurR-regulated permease PerM